MPTEKALLRTRLAAERAWLFSQLLDLDERTLSSEPVWEGWTSKDILAHVAARDELFTERTELALAGRYMDIVPVDLDARNAVIHAQRKEWEFERVLEACLTARKVYLDSFARVLEEELDRPIPIPFSETQSMRQWAEWRYQHDAKHGADLAAWRRRLAGPGSPGPRSLLLATLRAARKELLTAVALLPVEERESLPIQGHQTLKAVLGQIVDGQRRYLDDRQQMATRVPPDTGTEQVAETWSRGEMDASHSRSWDEIWRNLHATHQELLRSLVSRSQTDLEQPCLNSSGAQDSLYSRVRTCIDRDREYAAELRAVLTV